MTEIVSSNPAHGEVNSSTRAGFELTTLVVISTDCIGSCKSNNHTTTTTTAPLDSISTFLLYKHNASIEGSKYCYLSDCYELKWLKLRLSICKQI